MNAFRFVQKAIYDISFYFRCKEVKAEVISYWDRLSVLEEKDNQILGLPCYYRNVGIQWKLSADKDAIRAVFTDYSKRSKRCDEITFKIGERRIAQHEDKEESSLERKQETVLICVPHCDDEFFLAGGIIRKRINEGARVCVVFCCNNDKGGQDAFEVRHARALQALKILGVSQEQVFCLGYSNGHYLEKGKNIYCARNGEVVQNQAHRNQTYGTTHIADYHSLRYGKPAFFSWENMRSDLADLITELMPEEIYGIDMDGHIDHVLCSLLLEDVVGMTVKNLEGYTPKVYKGFAYGMSAYGKRDLYKGKHIRPTRRTWRYFYQMARKGYGLDNPRYCWDNRVRIKNPIECQVRDMHENVLISGFLCYKLMYSSIASFVNEDTVFWERYTDNLALKADIQVSDGDSEYLNDFKILDISNLRKKEFDRKCWAPKDADKKCMLRWAEKQRISAIKLYQNMNFLHGIKRIKIEAEDFSAEYDLKGNCFGDEISLQEPVITQWLSITLVSTAAEYGVDEIEVFSRQKKAQCVQEREQMIFA